jgi:hypothetical protein
MTKGTDRVGAGLVIGILNSDSSLMPKIFGINHKSIFVLDLASHVLKHTGMVGVVSGIQEFLIRG